MESAQKNVKRLLRSFCDGSTGEHYHPCARTWKGYKKPLTVQQRGPGKGRARSYQGIGVMWRRSLPPTCLPRLQAPENPVRTPASSHTIDRKPAAPCWLPATREEYLHIGIRGLENIGLLHCSCVFCNYFIWERRSRVSCICHWGEPSPASLGCLKPTHAALWSFLSHLFLLKL